MSGLRSLSGVEGVVVGVVGGGCCWRVVKGAKRVPLRMRRRKGSTMLNRARGEAPSACWRRTSRGVVGCGSGAGILDCRTSGLLEQKEMTG